MDYSWVLFNNLQLFTVINQSNLKLPQNTETLLRYIAAPVNHQIIPVETTYYKIREWFSDDDSTS
jgi:hypothetical protein